MRVGIDTNILVSFAIRPSADFEKIFDFIVAQGVLLVSEDSLAELFDVLSRKRLQKYIPLEQSIDYVEWDAGISEQVIVTEHVAACRDPKDARFLALAASGKADCILAGDHDLLDMVPFNGVPVYRPAEFIRRFIT